MKAKIAEFPNIGITAMGFPHGWECEPLWQSKTTDPMSVPPRLLRYNERWGVFFKQATKYQQEKE